MGESESGHKIIMDGAPEYGGQNKGPRPMEMLLLGMGACASFDIVMILQKSKQGISGCEVDITAERADAHPKVFTKIHSHYVVTGKTLSADKVARAIAMTAEKYCSASIILGKSAVMTHDFEIIES